MTLRVFTARIGTPGLTDALDVTRKSAKGDGLAFAPSWEILRPALKDLKDGADLTGFAQDPHNDLLGRYMRHRAWARYYAAFTAEMRESYRANRAAWERLLARDSVTLLCYCTDPALCHRTILAEDILPALGAERAHEVFE